MKFSNFRFWVFGATSSASSWTSSLFACFPRQGNVKSDVRLDIGESVSSGKSMSYSQSLLRRMLKGGAKNRHLSGNSRDLAASSCFTMEDSIFATGPSAPPPTTTPRPKHFLSRKRSSAPITPNTSTRRKTYLSNEGLYKTLARDSILRKSFEEFAADQYASENVSFMEQIFEWRTSHPGDLAKAKDICDMYIHEGSTLQVNISYFSRTTVESIIEKCETNNEKVPLDVFERAADEVTTMMRGGVWSSFVRRGGCDRAVSDVDITPLRLIMDERYSSGSAHPLSPREPLSPKERVKASTPRERVAPMSPKERVKASTPRERVAPMSPKERVKASTPRESIQRERAISASIVGGSSAMKAYALTLQ